MSEVKSTRIPWIDYAKSLAIFLVVLLHVHCTPEVTLYIDAMIMPLFYILSGYLFTYQNNPLQKQFIVKRSRQILFPYFWIGMVGWVAWVLVLRHYGDDASLNLEWYMPLKGMFTGVTTLLYHDVPLWSLLSFFIVEMFFYPLGRTLTTTIIVALVAFGASACLSEFVPQETMCRLPLALGPSLVGLGFYALGHIWRLFNEGSKLNRLLFGWPVMIVAVVLFVITARANGIVEFYICKFNNYALFMISSVTGTIVAVWLMNLLAKAIGSNRVVRFISNGTLIICGFHLLVFALIKGIALLVFGLEPVEIMQGYTKGILFAIVAFTGTLPIVWFIRKYLRFLVDK